MTAFLLVVTGVSLAIAAVASAIAWRVTRDERRRSAARVDALSRAIYNDDPELPPATAALFETPALGHDDRNRVIAAVGICVLAAILGLLFLAERMPPTPTPGGQRTAAPGGAPLELLALEQERDGDRLIVRGLVRNPPNGVRRDGLAAIVLLYNRGGDLLATGRAPVPAATLAGGDTTPFVVSVQEAADVERFRLSFRTNRRVEPHVDRRGRREPASSVEDLAQ
ncbi:MAG TPA: hypothetical protein VLV86_09460 [Vicinamibacterales bacterium]|nr:hypothetical protein [Vicinamibacterales bacterium]